MTLPIPLIDHVIVNARDALDDSAALWVRLGFTLTPRGHHSTGSINHLAILGTDYIELLGVPPSDGGVPAAPGADVLNWPAGLNGLVFKTTDSDALYDELTEAGAPVLPPLPLARPAQIGDRTYEVAFRNVRLEADASPAGRMFFCHHLTPNHVWYDPWRRHPNGAVGLAGLVIAAEDPAAYAALFRLLFGEHAVRSAADGSVLVAGLASIEVATPATVAMRFGDAAPALAGRPCAMAALIVRTASLRRTREALAAGGIPLAPGDGPILLPAEIAGGFALLFTE